MVQKYAAKRGLDPAFIYALMRQESGFDRDIKSGAGAIGLMQMMPATGKAVAKKEKWARFDPFTLTEAEVNISLGTAYLRDLRKDYKNNPFWVLANYNAGPEPTRRWINTGSGPAPGIRHRGHQLLGNAGLREKGDGELLDLSHPVEQPGQILLRPDRRPLGRGSLFSSLSPMRRPLSGLWSGLFLLRFRRPGGRRRAGCGRPTASKCWSVARLKYGGGGDWYAGPSMLLNLSKRLRSDLGLPACAEERQVAVMDGNLYEYPILFMTGHGNVAFSEEERKVLREYLLRGGLLFADDNYGMDTSFRAR